MNTEHILIVDDDRLVTRILGSLLERQGYKVTPALTIGAALQAVRAGMPDLILLDLTVLDADPFGGLTDGFAFLHLLRLNYPQGLPPVIIHSVDSSPRVQALAASLGVASVVAKGCPAEELLKTVRTTLDQARAVQAA